MEWRLHVVLGHDVGYILPASIDRNIFELTAESYLFYRKVEPSDRLIECQAESHRRGLFFLGTLFVSCSEVAWNSGNHNKNKSPPATNADDDDGRRRDPAAILLGGSDM